VGAATFRTIVIVILVSISGAAAAQDTTTHSIQFVTVAPEVKLEVIDWGGPATPGTPTMVLLTGLGDTAHRFDPFATQLVKSYRVFGITRRGFGVSSVPDSGYDADRLGDDVLAVMDTLKLQKPILIGHSLGGEELSSIASRHPERAKALIYLDAGYGYAFAWPGSDMPAPPKPEDPVPPMIRAIITGMRQYTRIPLPALAIYAVPRRVAPNASDDDRARSAEFDKIVVAQADAFEKGVPGSRVVRIANAGHYVHGTNEAEVLREIHQFVNGLKFE
jgi:pimeloyl-ACP methyl ester carboxylesterase